MLNRLKKCLTISLAVVIFKSILSEMLDPRLLGKISLTGVFYFQNGRKKNGYNQQIQLRKPKVY